MASITSMITTPLMDFLSEKYDKTIQQEVVEDHPIEVDGGGKATSTQRGSGQVTTEGGGGKATAVCDGGEITTSDMKNNNNKHGHLLAFY